MENKSDPVKLTIEVIKREKKVGPHLFIRYTCDDGHLISINLDGSRGKHGKILVWLDLEKNSKNVVTAEGDPYSMPARFFIGRVRKLEGTPILMSRTEVAYKLSVNINEYLSEFIEAGELRLLYSSFEDIMKLIEHNY